MWTEGPAAYRWLGRQPGSSLPRRCAGPALGLHAAAVKSGPLT